MTCASGRSTLWRSLRRRAVVACTVTALALYGSVLSAPRVAVETPVLRLVGQTGGVAGVVVVANGRAYEVVGTSLVILDVSDPASPHPIGRSEPLSELVTDVAVSGDRAYLATQGGIRIMDLTTPEHPSVTATYQPDGVPRLVEVSKPYLFAIVAAGNEAEFQVLAIDETGGLSLIGRTNTAASLGGAVQMSAAGRMVYLAADRQGVIAIDVSDPTTPTFAGAYEDIIAGGIAIGQDRVYVVGYTETRVSPERIAWTWYLMALEYAIRHFPYSGREAAYCWIVFRSFVAAVGVHPERRGSVGNRRCPVGHAAGRGGA